MYIIYIIYTYFFLTKYYFIYLLSLFTIYKLYLLFYIYVGSELGKREYEKWVIIYLLRCARTISRVVMTFFSVKRLWLRLPATSYHTRHTRHFSFPNDDDDTPSQDNNNNNDATSQDNNNDNDNNASSGWREGRLWTGSGPKRRVFGPGMFFFFHSFFFTNIYLLFTRQQAHGPTLASKASRWAVLRLTNPTLATSASRWGFLPLFNTRTHPRYKRESVGRFHTRNHPHTPPSLQTRVGGGFFYIILTRTHPRCKRESVGRFHTRTHPVPHPHSKRESVGSYIVLFMQMRPKRTSFGPQSIY